MAQSTFSAAGSSQNSWCARGSVPSVGNSRNPTIIVASATPTSITSDLSGNTFLLPSVGANIFLPTPPNAGAGFNCKFQQTSVGATTAWTISPTGTVAGAQTNIYGTLGIPSPGATLYNNSTGFVYYKQVAGTGTLNFGITSQVGDWVNLNCDGTNYIVNGFGSTGK